MTPEAYWTRIRNVPLRTDRDSSDGEAVICRAQDGTPVSVTKPEFVPENKREDVVRYYEDMYSPRMN